MHRERGLSSSLRSTLGKSSSLTNATIGRGGKSWQMGFRAILDGGSWSAVIITASGAAACLLVCTIFASWGFFDDERKFATGVRGWGAFSQGYNYIHSRPPPARFPRYSFILWSLGWPLLDFCIRSSKTPPCDEWKNHDFRIRRMTKCGKREGWYFFAFSFCLWHNG